MSDRINFAVLTRAQRDALGRVAIDDDSALNPKTAKALETRGLIVGRDVRVPGHPPVTVRRYFVPLHVHMQWCEWCSRDFKEAAS